MAVRPGHAAQGLRAEMRQVQCEEKRENIFFLGLAARYRSLVWCLHEGPSSTAGFDLTADELAKWIERQGDASWWSVDGDPLLYGNTERTLLQFAVS